ncbi:unnamed protein product [Paramecium primaurelia]|uniref:Uncharacterized protein n=1 Tax=Paramecium primaurelia TaxID=5886 RepID=A0A8S1QQR4_PARPR|nr:unnamed protein product [Paramecium primaurelia]
MIQQQQNNQSKYFSHKLLYSITQKYPKHCFAQAINNNNTLLVLGSSIVCKIIYLKNELKQLQQTKMHKGAISTLNFFKSRQQFISGSYDSSIIIQPTNLLQNLKYITKLQGHSRGISCLVVNPNTEDLIISGSVDKTIRFWYYSSSSNWSCSQTINEHNDQVNGLSINQDEINKFYQWKDLMDNCGILNKRFLKMVIVLHLQQQIYLHFNPVMVNIYNYIQLIIPLDYMQNQKEPQVKGVGSDCQYYFPQIYISSRKLLLSKNGYFVNLLQFNFDSENWDCEFIEGIEFDQRGNFGNIFGTMSDNGEYLITWDCMAGNIEIRQFTYKNDMNDHQIIN